MQKVDAKQRFLKIKDYISASDIVKEIDTFMCEEDLHEFCDILCEEYDIDLEEDYEDYNSDEDDMYCI